MTSLFQNLRSRDGNNNTKAAPKPWSSRLASTLSLSLQHTDTATVPSSPVSTTPSVFDGPILELTAATSPHHRTVTTHSDTQLLAIARAAQLQSETQRKARVPEFAVEGRTTSRFRWRRRTLRRNGFALFSRESSERLVVAEPVDGVVVHIGAPDTRAATVNNNVTCHQVLAVGDVRCSVRELALILRTTTDTELQMLLRGLYDSAFVTGAVDYTAAVSTTGTDTNSSTDTDPLAEHVTVKTLVFARANMFARNEQWRVVERFAFDAQRETCTLTLASLTGADGYKSTNSTIALQNVIADVAIENVPDTASARVVYHISYCEPPSGSSSSGSAGSTASVRATKARLLALAAGVSRLPELVHRRRLGNQSLANCIAIAALNNAQTRCACCSRSLHVLATKRVRCHVCGLAVCNRDWSIYEVENQGRNTAARVCVRCVAAIERCEYANVIAQSLATHNNVQSARSDSLAIGHNECEPAAIETTTSTSSMGTALASLLTDALRASTNERKASVRTVIKYLVAVDSEQHSSSTTTQQQCTSATPLTTLTDSSDEALYNSAVDALVSDSASPPSLDQCVVAHRERRTYPLFATVRDSGDTTSDPLLPLYPVPTNDAKRLRVIADCELLTSSYVREQLDIVCALAARELECAISVIAIVGDDTQLIVASNVAALRLQPMPRTESVCQHVVTVPEPLVVAHPEADVRFAHLPALQELAIRFYCGSLLTRAESLAVVGTLCCLDTKTDVLTPSQYATMSRLAETASRILRLREPVSPVSTSSVSAAEAMAHCVHKVL